MERSVSTNVRKDPTTTNSNLCFSSSISVSRLVHVDLVECSSIHEYGDRRTSRPFSFRACVISDPFPRSQCTDSLRVWLEELLDGDVFCVLHFRIEIARGDAPNEISRDI